MFGSPPNFTDRFGMRFNIKRGRDIRLPGAPTQILREAGPVKSAALQGRDLPGIRPLFRVSLGEDVAAGQALFVDRARPEIAFASPASGKVAGMTLGHRRVLDSLVIEIDGNKKKTFEAPQRLDGESARAFLLASGSWPAFRTRPFDRIPDPQSEPHAIFVTAMDSEPLAADAAVVLQPLRDKFRAGLESLRHLTKGLVFVCQAAGTPLAEADGQIQVVEFSGRHPAGLPGTHIECLMPANRERTVWHIGYQDVIAIGNLFKTGTLWTDRIVSLAGSGVRAPGLVSTRLGANLDDLVKGELEGGNTSILSGSPISGRPSGYLARYHTQVSVLKQASPRRPSALEKRIAALFGAGHPGAIIPVSAYDAVLPARILAVPLMRALAVGDAETAERLGCLDLAEDDMALLTHVCPAGIDYRPLLRGVLDEIEAEL